MYVVGGNFFIARMDSRDLLELVGAELLVDNLPDNFVGRHLARYFSRWIGFIPATVKLGFAGEKREEGGAAWPSR